MRFENTTVNNFDGAIRGMRNPMESWEKSDSMFSHGSHDEIGPNDVKLMQKLLNASEKEGNSHSKFLRQIMVCVDITAPLYWWKEMDQYRVGVTTNSTSTMHKLASTQITLDCFEMGDFESMTIQNLCASGNSNSNILWESTVEVLETFRIKYLETKDKRYWKELIRLLPESWLQTRTTTLNYQVIRQIYFDRRYHKLSEWSEDTVAWINSLPYSSELIKFDGGIDG